MSFRFGIRHHSCTRFQNTRKRKSPTTECHGVCTYHCTDYSRKKASRILKNFLQNPPKFFQTPSGEGQNPFIPRKFSGFRTRKRIETLPQYLRARGGRAVVIGLAPGGVRRVIARGGAAGWRRQRGGDPAGGRGQRQRSAPAGRQRAASSGRRGKAAGGAGCFRLAVCRRCSMARRSAVCWHRAGGRRWHAGSAAGRAAVLAAAGGARRALAAGGVQVSGPAKQVAGAGGGVVRRSSWPFCCCCRPGAGLLLLFAEGVRFFT